MNKINRINDRLTSSWFHLVNPVKNYAVHPLASSSVLAISVSPGPT